MKFKDYWNKHTAFCCLVLSYLIPAMSVYFLTFDVQLAICVGGAVIFLASPIIWRFVKP